MAETRFHTLLRIKAEEAIAIRSDSIAVGGAADYPDYLKSVGYIQGLRAALDLAREVEMEMDQ